MGKLDDKVAIITGGGGGIGIEAAKLFCREGAKVMLVDVGEDAMAEAVKSIGDDKADCVVADVTKAEDVKSYVARTVERFGGVDITLLNAGIEGKVAKITEQTDEDFDRVMGVNVRGVWLGLKHTLPEIEKRGGGSVVITSSTAGIRALGGISPYTTSKHAVVGLMRAAAMEGAPVNIRVNSVHPAPIDTRMIYSLEDQFNPNRGNAQPMAQGIPLGRYGQPEEVANLMLFLASADSSFCTGGCYMVDGGVSAGRV